MRRLTANERRDDLLSRAATIITASGIDGLNISDLADASGVSRPIVYRHFDNRAAIFVGLIRRFADALSVQFAESARADMTLHDAAVAYVGATAHVIDAHGVGVWRLLGGDGVDPETARVASTTRQQLAAPWLPRIQRLLDIDATGAAVVARMLVATTRAALDAWIDEVAPRDVAVAHAARAIARVLGK